LLLKHPFLGYETGKMEKGKMGAGAKATKYRNLRSFAHQTGGRLRADLSLV
jgi:hypothetical protein